MKKNRGDDKDFCLKNLIEGVMFLNLDVFFKVFLFLSRTMLVLVKIIRSFGISIKN